MYIVGLPPQTLFCKIWTKHQNLDTFLLSNLSENKSFHAYMACISLIYLRIDYCGFGPFCGTGTKLLLSISLLKVLICIIIMLIKRQIIRLSNDIDNIKMGKRILLKIN